MGANTRIGWADHTFNPWIGCTKVSPACDFCYAEAIDTRLSPTSHWGSGVPRRRTGEHNWNEPRRWNRIAKEKGDHRPRVFCASMGDWADNEVPEEWRTDLWQLIRETPYLRWMLLTKRIGNAFHYLPEDFEWNFQHVGIMSTIANQDEAERDIPKLLKLKGERKVPWVGISAEPMLSLLDLSFVFQEYDNRMLEAYLSGAGDWPGCGQAMHAESYKLDWVIIGGESGSLSDARPFVLEHARSLAKQCIQFGTAVFIKQLGRHPTNGGKRIKLRDNKGEDQGEWPEDLRVQLFPKYLAGTGFPVAVPAPASQEPNLFTGAAQ